MTIENTTTLSHSATFTEFLIKRDSEDDNFGNFHCAFGDNGIAFPRSASKFVTEISESASSQDEEIFNAERIGNLMIEVGSYILAAVTEYESKNMQEEAV